jgi:rifampicin phosphotransferase
MASPRGPAGKRRKITRLKVFWVMLGFNRRFRRMLREHRAAVRDIAARPWQQLSDDAMLNAVERMVELHERLDPLVGFSNGYGSAFKDLLEAQLLDIAGERAPALMARLLAGSGEVTSAEQGYRIADLARTVQNNPEALAWLGRRQPAQTWDVLPPHSPFRRELARFLEDFGHRAVYEVDVLNPRWCDAPGYILD